jgi:hypothetical protein
MSSTYLPKFPPFKHQGEALDFLDTRPMFPTSADVAAWLMEFGTGKSKVILDEFGIRELMGDLNTLLVIAPKGVYMNWITQEIPLHLSDDLRERALISTLDLSGGFGKRANIEKILFTRDRPRILVVNVEALSGVERVRNAILAFLEGCYEKAMIAIDEVTTVKGYGYYKQNGTIHGSKRSAFIAEKLAPLARARRIATGLIAPNSPLDIYMPYTFLDWTILGFETFRTFQQRYCVIKRTNFMPKVLQEQGHFRKDSNIILNYRNEGELQQKISAYSFRKRLEDCMDLPPRIYQFRDVEMTPEQDDLYHKLRKEAIAEFENTRVTATMAATRIMRLHQIACGYMVDDDEKIYFLKENRTKALIEMLEDHNGKAIIWAPYRPLIKKIATELRRAFGETAVVEFWGDTKEKDREIAKERFREDPACRLFVSNQSVGGRGNTMVTANLEVYYTNNWNLEHRLNSEGRIYRYGQTKTCLYVDLRVPGSVEDKVIQRLRKKIDVASTIMGDDWREWLI